MDFIMY